MSDHQTKAAELFRQAAEKGDPEAMFQYGLCLRDGKGVPQSISKSDNWFRKAASAGQSEAAAQLENCSRHHRSPLHPAINRLSHNHLNK